MKKNQMKAFDSILDNNLKVYKQIFHIEHLLRKMCYAAYIAIYCTKWKKHLPAKVLDKLSLRKKSNKKYDYLTDLAYDHPMWYMTLFEILLMLTEHDEVWAYFKRKSKADKRTFTLKVKELEHIRNLVSHSNLVDKSINVHFSSLYQYFSNIIDNFRSNLNFASAMEGEYSKRNTSVFELKKDFEIFNEKEEKDEDFFSYRLIRNLGSNQIGIRESDSEVYVSFTPYKDGEEIYTDLDFVLQSLSSSVLKNYLIMLLITGDNTGYFPLQTNFIINKKIKDDPSATNELISLLSNDLIHKDVTGLSHSDRHDYMFSQARKYRYHPLIWEHFGIMGG